MRNTQKSSTKHIAAHLGALLLAAYAAGAAAAEPIPDLHSTGVGDSGGFVGPGYADPHYELISNFNFPPRPIVASTMPEEWNTGSGPSQWVAPRADATQDFPDPIGNSYTYQTTFDLRGFDPATAVITGVALADDGGEIMLNEKGTGIPLRAHHDSLKGKKFQIASGFQPGVNTLAFRVVNATLEFTNPTGLRAQVTGSADRDDIDPTVTRVTVSNPEVNVLSEARNSTSIEIEYSDMGAGVYYVELYLTDPGNSDPESGILLTRTIVPEQNGSGVIKFDVEFPVNANVGMWLMSGQVRDAALNWVPFIGGQDGVPFGINVSSKVCDPFPTEVQKGPYGTVEFGAATDTSSYVGPFSGATETRLLQASMGAFDGWDKQLAEADLVIRRAYCDALDWKARYEESGSSDDFIMYSLSRERIKVTIVDELLPKQNRIRHLLNGIEEALLSERYADLLASIRSSDERDYLHGKNKKLDEAKTAWSIVSVLKDIYQAVQGTLQVGIGAYVKVASGIYKIINDYNTMLMIVGENVDIETRGKPFMELWLMQTEMTILYDEYEKKLLEYSDLHGRLAL